MLQTTVTITSGQVAEAVGASIAGWILASLVQWGVWKERVKTVSRRIDAHDEELRELRESLVPRKEYQAMHSENRGRLDRIERKVDGLFSMAGERRRDPRG